MSNLSHAFYFLLLLGSAAAAPASTVTSSTLTCPSADQASYTTGSQTYKVDCNVNYSFGDMVRPNGLTASNFAACVAQCAARSGCVAVSYASGPKSCYLKKSVGRAEVQRGTWSAQLVSGGSGSSSGVSTSSSTVSTRSSTSSTSSSSTTIPSSTSSSIGRPSRPTPSFATSVTITPSSTSAGVSSTPTSSSSSSSSSSIASSRASSTSSTSTSSASPTGGTPVVNTGKRGLAYNNATLTQFFSLSGQNSKVSWAYNWYSAPVDSPYTGTTLNPALEFVPMLWSDQSSLTSIWSSNVAGVKQALAFNEPDQCGGGGACMGDPAGVAAAYKKWMQPLAGQVRLGAPAVTNGGAPMGLTYLRQFLGNCTSCQVDFVPVHWYDSATNVAYFKWYMEQAYAAGGNRPIWITEFAGSGTDAQQQQFLKEVLPWLDSTSYVERYAWFGAFTGNLILPDGSGLSALGQVYNSL